MRELIIGLPTAHPKMISPLIIPGMNIVKHSKIALPLLFALLLTLTSVRIKAQDFVHLEAYVEPFPLEKMVKGQVTHHIYFPNQADSIFINGIRMQYFAVSINEEQASYNPSDTGLWLHTAHLPKGDTHRISLAYQCLPRKGLYFVGWNQEYPNPHPQVWTQGQGIDHRHWLPHHDDQRDKITFDLHITFQQDYTVVSNGQLISKKQVPHSRQVTWHYKTQQPMSSYLIAIAVGKYAVQKTRSPSGVPMEQYYYAEQADRYPYTYSKNEEIFNFMEQAIGLAYPWPVYRQVPVQNFRHGAMENTMAVVFGDFFQVDSVAFNDQNYTYVNAHELAHHWHGNWVTATGTPHHWLHEGFATYYQWLSEQHLYGKNYGVWQRKQALDRIYAAMQRDTLALSQEGAGAERYYQKGAYVLHMLRKQLGDDPFREALRHYLQKYAQGLVTTDSLRLAIQESSGRDMRAFLERWIHTAGNPIWKVRSRLKPGSLEVQLQEGSYMPFGKWEVPLKVMFANGDSLRKNLTFTHGAHGEGLLSPMKVPLPKGQKVAWWVLNPGMEKLLQYSEEKPDRYARAQLAGSSHILDQYAALQSLRDSLSGANLLVTEKVAAHPRRHYGVRALALQMLLQKNAEKYQPLLAAALLSKNIELQKAAIRLVRNPGKEVLQALQQIRLAPSYSLRETAIHLLINREKARKNRWLYDSAYVRQPGIPGHKVHLTALAYQLLFFKDKAAQEQLIAYASPAYDFMTRIKALEITGELGLMNEELLHLHFLALWNNNWKLRKAAREGLRKAAQKEGIKDLIARYRKEKEAEWTDLQKRRAARTFDF